MSEQQIDQNLEAKKGSLGQQILIVVLVIAVGGLFGMGGSLSLLQTDGSQRVLAGNVDAGERNKLATTMAGVMSLGSPDPERRDGMLQYTSQMAYRNLLFANFAEQEGLKPKGSAAEELLRTFVNEKTFMNPELTNAQALKRLEGTEYEITGNDLLHMLTVQQAADAYRTRYLETPAIGSASAKWDAQLQQDKIETVEVVLSAKRLVDPYKEAVAADEVALNSAYIELREERFRVPERYNVLAITLDQSAVRRAAIVNDEAIQRYYDENQSQYKDVEGKVKPLDEVKSEIREELSKEIAKSVQFEALEKFNNGLIDAGLDSKEAVIADIAAFAKGQVISAAKDERINEDVPFNVYAEAYIERQVRPVLDIKNKDGVLVASLENRTQFFSHESGYVLSFAPAQSDADLFVMVRAINLVAADFTPLADVKDEVIDYVAARKAYPDLLASAQKIKDEAGTDLKAYFTEERLKTWNTEIKEESVAALADYSAPAEEIDGFSNDDTTAIELATNKNQIFVVADAAQGGIPQIRLVQAKEYKASEVNADAAVTQRYRRQLEQFFDMQLNQHMERSLEESAQ